MRLVGYAVALGILLHAGAVLGDEAPRSSWDRRFAVAAHFDLIPFPMCDALLVVEVAPLPFVSLEVGGGIGVVQRPIFLAMAHLQMTFEHWAPGIELGAVTGPFVWQPGTTTNGFLAPSVLKNFEYLEHINAAVFARAGLSVAYRSTAGFHLRIHSGVTGLLNRQSGYRRGDDGEYLGSTELDRVPAVLPYVGATTGYAFDL